MCIRDRKRTVEHIEGIEEREESPKSKAKSKSATTKPAADDPRTLSLKERWNAHTVLNQFMKHEIKRIEDAKNIDVAEYYLTEIINEPDELQKELENYITHEKKFYSRCLWKG